MTTRRAISADTTEIVRLARGMFTDMNGEKPSSTWERNAHEVLERRLCDDVIAVVVDHPHGHEQLLAFAAGMITYRLPSTHNPTGRVGYIQWVATDTAWRRRGLARAVTTALLDIFDQLGISMNELHTSSDARKLYAALGFAPAQHPAMRRYP